MNRPLLLILHLVIGSTLMGIGVTAALIMGYGTALPIALAALGGFLAAIPPSWLIARALTRTGPLR